MIYFNVFMYFIFLTGCENFATMSELCKQVITKNFLEEKQKQMQRVSGYRTEVKNKMMNIIRSKLLTENSNSRRQPTHHLTSKPVKKPMISEGQCRDVCPGEDEDFIVIELFEIDYNQIWSHDCLVLEIYSELVNEFTTLVIISEEETSL